MTQTSRTSVVTTGRRIILCFLALVLTYSGICQINPDSVVVLPMKIAAPVSAKKIGQIKVGDNAFKMGCDYEKVIGDAKRKAAAMGGNVVKITTLEEPVFVGKCYRVKADVYYADDLHAYGKPDGGGTLLSGGSAKNYAVLCIYRLRDTIVPEPTYKLHLNEDSVLCTIRGRSKHEFRIYKDGLIILWAKTEKRADLELNVKMGETYYIRCGVQPGQLWMTPVLELVNKDDGVQEFSKLGRDKNDDVHYLDMIH
jgi:hypothetical protein